MNENPSTQIKIDHFNQYANFVRGLNTDVFNQNRGMDKMYETEVKNFAEKIVADLFSRIDEINNCPIPEIGKYYGYNKDFNTVVKWNITSSYSKKDLKALFKSSRNTELKSIVADRINSISNAENFILG